MPREMIKHRYDAKFYVEQAMEKLGFDPHSRKQPQLQGNACQVYYGDFNIELETQMSYWNEIPIIVEFIIDNNEDMPYAIMQVQAFVTWYVEATALDTDAFTSFYFTHVSTDTDGNGCRVTMTAIVRAEVDWVLESEVEWCGQELDPTTVNSVLSSVRTRYEW